MFIECYVELGEKLLKNIEKKSTDHELNWGDLKKKLYTNAVVIVFYDVLNKHGYLLECTTWCVVLCSLFGVHSMDFDWMKVKEII